MSFQAMTWATEQDLKANEKIVLVMLANRCNHDTGRCDPAHKRLARECGMSLSTLKRCIEKLEAAGLLTIEHRELNGVSLPNQYHLHLDVSSQRTHPVQKKTGVGSKLGGGVGSHGADGSVHSELQNSNINQEVEPGSEPLTGAGNPAPAAGGFNVPAVLSEQQQHDERNNGPSYERIREVFWEWFDKAYEQRYHTTIPRNAKTNAQVKQLIQRLGREAPGVARFYVENVSEQRVLMASHTLDFLLLNAEGYRTQWMNGRAMTQGRARQLDCTQTNANAADEAIRMLREREGRE